MNEPSAPVTAVRLIPSATFSSVKDLACLLVPSSSALTKTPAIGLPFASSTRPLSESPA